jgi:hypothetical protein
MQKANPDNSTKNYNESDRRIKFYHK